MFSAKILKNDYKLGMLTAHVYESTLHLGGWVLLFVYTSYCLDNYPIKFTKPYNPRKRRGTRIHVLKSDGTLYLISGHQ